MEVDDSMTPLEKYGESLSVQIGKLAMQQNGIAVYELLQKMIRVEKAGRLHRCFKYFGTTICSKKDMNPWPFFIWQRKITHDLTKDPTEDIIRTIKANIFNGQHHLPE